MAHDRCCLKQERANPQKLEGKQALFVVNLEARKMRGVISEGMLFDIGHADSGTRWNSRVSFPPRGHYFMRPSSHALAYFHDTYAE